MVLLALSLGLAADAPADPWQSRLQGGAEVSVDPSTRRAVGTVNGQQRPLWDGVHRLDDGSTLIVRDGIAVPTAPMVEQWQADAEPEPLYEYHYCKQLVRKTCGFDDVCDRSAACLRARTLLGDEAREQLGLDPRRTLNAQTAAGERCQQALSDPSFPACESPSDRADNSRCQAVVERVCGPEAECGGTQACDAARQLQALEADERLVNADPSALSLSGSQCLEAMTNAFFEPCEPAP
jgi:hypothetical protein